MDDEVNEGQETTPEQAAIIPPIDRRTAMPQNYDLVGFPPCARCIHLLTLGSQHSGDGWTCRAYPDGIFATTVAGMKGWEHDRRLMGDQGFRYAPTVFWTDDGVPYAHDWDGVAFRVDQVTGGGAPQKPVA